MPQDEMIRCYEVLGLKPSASLAEARTAYRDLAQVWHPDRFAHNERLQLKAQEELKAINAAFSTISEVLMRKEREEQERQERERRRREDEERRRAEESARQDRESLASALREHFSALDLPTNASMKEVEQAYRDALDIWAPERFEHGSHLKEKALRQVDRATNAYRAITNYNKRQTKTQNKGEHRQRAEENTPSSTPETAHQSLFGDNAPNPIAIAAALMVIMFVLAKLLGL